MHNAAVVLLAVVLVVVPARPAYGTAELPSGGYGSPLASVFLPAGVVTPFDPPRSRWGAGHRGVDVEAAVGDPVHAPAAGTVTFTGNVAGRGVVVITHPDGLRSSMEPVGPEVSVGTHVERGDVVGSVKHSEASHCAPETCLHWGVSRGDRYVDPLTLVHRPVIVLLPDP